MQNRDYAIDFIRLLAIIGVVIIHVTTAFTDRAAPFSFDFYISHFINQVFRFAVPLFFAISGFLLATHYSVIPNIFNFYKKRFSKILLPFIVWSAIYYFLIFPHPKDSIFSIKFVENILTGNASYQLYFIPAIILLYFVFPFIIKYKNLLLTKWFIVFLFIIETVDLSYVFFNHTNLPTFSPIRNAFYNLLPFVVGIYAALNLEKFKLFVSRNIRFLSLVTLISGLIIFIESTRMFATTGIASFLRDQWRISVMIYGISLGALIYHLYPKTWSNWSSYLARFSFGVFFVHVAILDFLLEIVDKNGLGGISGLIATLLATTTLSFAFSIILSRIKFIDKILGLRG